MRIVVKGSGSDMGVGVRSTTRSIGFAIIDLLCNMHYVIHT